MSDHEPGPRMTQYTSSIRASLRVLSRRERRLLVARMLGSCALIGGFLGLWVLLAPFSGVANGVAAMGLVVGFAAGMWWLVVGPMLVGWRRAADLVRQAKLTEAIQPGFEGRLVTVAERLEGPRGQESEAILAWIAGRSAEGLRSVRADAVHSGRPVVRVASLAMVLAGVLLTLVLVLPGGLGATWAYWVGEESALSVDSGKVKGTGEYAQVGDLAIEYVYPTYTGLEPLEVTNSTGEVHGPPGTLVRVRARAAEPIEHGMVVAYEEPSESAEVDGRNIRGTFTIMEEEGAWRLDLVQSAGAASSRSFPIVPEPDLAPEVLVDSPQRIEVALDAPLDLPWQALDDFGLTRIVLLVDGKEEREIRAFEERRAESDGRVSFTPRQLGMSVGMTVEVQVGAWDNNEWAGSQLGVNQPAIQVVVKRADELAMLSVEERRNLRNELVDLLADQLIQAWPPVGTMAAVGRAGEQFDGFYRDLRTLIEKTPAISADRRVRRMVARVMNSGTEFITFTQVNFDVRSGSSTPDAESMRRAGELRSVAVEENEHTIIWLDRFIQMFALGQAVEEAQKGATLAKNLESAIATEARDSEVLDALERVRASLDRMNDIVKEMDQDSIRSMVEGRAREIGLVRESVAEALEAGDREQADELAKRMARQLRELNDDLEYQLRRVEEEEDQLGEEMKSLVEELQRMEREQRQLQSEVQQARQSGDAQGAAEAERMWAQVETLANEAEGIGRQLQDAALARGGMFMFQKRIEAGVRATERLGESAAARDLRRSQLDVGDSIQHWVRAQGGVAESRRRQVLSKLEAAERLLNQLDRESSQVDPKTAAQARALEARQAELDAAMDQVMQQASEVAAKMPIEPRGMEEALQRGKSSMQEAAEDLRNGRPMPAEGSQGQAAERLKEAREALEEAAQQMQSSGSGARSGEPSDGASGEDDGESDGSFELDGGESLSAKDINLDEEFDLDAFQRDVLRGARGNVPEAYRAMKKRYYEELMTQ